jgi:hypothetical protein
MNGATDIAWEGIKYNGLSVFETFPDIQFVDYTTSFKRAMAYANGKMPSNYCLTFSRTENNWAQCVEVLSAGGNVAAVFAGELPSTYKGYRVISGDNHDLLHLNPRGVILGLSPKGRKAKRDTSGFIVRNAA